MWWVDATAVRGAVDGGKPERDTYDGFGRVKQF